MLAVDVEATGTNPAVHSIVAIGAVDFTNAENTFYGECRAFREAHVMEDALRVNGFTEAEIFDPAKQTEADLITAFLEWAHTIPNRTLLGQNISFDREFLRAAAQRAQINFTLAYRSIDTHSLCYMHMVQRGITPPVHPKKRRSDLNLDTILQYCGIPQEPKPHHALNGARAHAETAARLLYGRKFLPTFQQYPVPWQEKGATINA